MTPKEKAIQLVSKMLEFASTNDYDYEAKGAGNDYHNAKQCALIAVDYILNSEPKKAYFIKGTWITPNMYWQEVKKEIENY